MRDHSLFYDILCIAVYSSLQWRNGRAGESMALKRVPKMHLELECVQAICTVEVGIPERPGVSQACRSLIARMLTKDPYDRISIQEILANPWVRNGEYLPYTRPADLETHQVMQTLKSFIPSIVPCSRVSSLSMVFLREFLSRMMQFNKFWRQKWRAALLDILNDMSPFLVLSSHARPDFACTIDDLISSNCEHYPELDKVTPLVVKHHTSCCFNCLKAYFWHSLSSVLLWH